MRRSRRQSVPSLVPAGNSPSNHSPLSSTPLLFRVEPESPISLHEWQRSINDRIKSPFPTEFYQPTPSPPPPVPKIPHGTVNMHSPTPLSQNPNRKTMATSMSHKSLSQSVTSNLSSALSSVTSPSSRRKSRAFSPSEMKRVRDADQVSMTSADSTTPSPTVALQQGHFDDDQQESLNAEKVLEQAMRHHQQRRNQQRFGGPGSLKSKASTLSARESAPSSPTQKHTSPANRSGTTIPTTRVNASPPGLSIASFEVLIRELEEEEAERKRKEKLDVSQPPKTIPPPATAPPDVAVPQPQSQPEPQPRPKRPSLNDAKRRSTGSILFPQPLTPTLPLNKEYLFPLAMDRKVSLSAQQSRISVASFGSTQSDGKRNSGHELTFNFVDWSGIAGGCAVSERRASREFNAMMVRSKSGFGEFDESRRISSTYNFGRRGSVF